MTLRRGGDDGRPPLRGWQQKALVAVAVLVIVAVILITVVSGQSFF